MRGKLTDSVDKAVRATNGLSGKRDKQRRGSADIADGENAASDEDGPWDSATGILDLVAHGRAGLDAREG